MPNVEEHGEIFAVRFDATAASSFNENLRLPDAEAVMSACTSLIATVNR
jgi:hypothetical protein